MKKWKKIPVRITISEGKSKVIISHRPLKNIVEIQLPTTFGQGTQR